MKDTNLQFYEGEANTVAVSLVDADDAPLDLTGLSISYRALKTSGQTVILDFTDADSITVDDAPGGLLTIEFSAVDTTQTPGQYAHELRLSGAGYVETVMTGFLTISDSAFVGA